MTTSNDTPRSSAEIDKQIREAAGSIVSVPSKFPGGGSHSVWSTRWPGTCFEQGVYEALRWVAGRSDRAPMDKS